MPLDCLCIKRCREECPYGAGDPQITIITAVKGVRLLHQLRGLPEICLPTGGVHHGVDFTLANNRTGKHRLAGFSRGGQ
jgi:hypothetical protein